MQSSIDGDLITEYGPDYVLATQPFNLKQLDSNINLIDKLFDPDTGDFFSENDLNINVAGSASGPYTVGNIENLTKITYSNIASDPDQEIVIAVFFVNRQFNKVNTTVKTGGTY
jgi:hypothetical protein